VTKNQSNFKPIMLYKTDCMEAVGKNQFK